MQLERLESEERRLSTCRICRQTDAAALFLECGTMHPQGPFPYHYPSRLPPPPPPPSSSAPALVSSTHASESHYPIWSPTHCDRSPDIVRKVRRGAERAQAALPHLQGAHYTGWQTHFFAGISCHQDRALQHVCLCFHFSCRLFDASSPDCLPCNQRVCVK